VTTILETYFQKKILDLSVKHLGMEGVNCDGRKTQFGFFFEPE